MIAERPPMHFQQFASLPRAHPRTLVHLLSCGACRDAAIGEMLVSDAPIGRQVELSSSPQRWSPAAIAAEALPLDQAATSIAQRDSPEEQLRLDRLVDTLEQLRAEDLSPRKLGRRYARREVLEAVLARGEACLRAEPFRSEQLGLVGLFLAGRIDAGDSWVAPGVVRSGLLVGSARRLLGRLKEAELAFQQVSTFLCDPSEEAAYARELALLRWQQGRSCDAGALLTRAAELLEEIGEPKGAAVGWALLGLLRCEEADGVQTARALAPLLLSQASLNPQLHPELALRVRLALARCEAERGDRERAMALLEGARALLKLAEVGDAVREPGLALAATEGWLLNQDGDPRAAEQKLLEVRAAQLRAGRLAESTLASLDLALVSVRRSNLDRCESLADELAFRFKGEPGLIFALQALTDFEEAVLARPKESKEAHAIAGRFLRQSFRAKGIPISPLPFP